jgi:antitoxin (DNA-binding transcriptional repressor) of toxin-antitoxin stability system
MLVISSREFRQNQRKYFDKVDQGEQIIVQRGKDKSYALTPVKEDDLYFNETMIKRIKEITLQARNGEYEEVTSLEGVKELLGL